MKPIQDLSPEERRHFILCDCGAYYDMRNLAEVFRHLHSGNLHPEWSYSIKKDDPVAYLPSGERIDLN